MPNIENFIAFEHWQYDVMLGRVARLRSKELGYAPALRNCTMAPAVAADVYRQVAATPDRSR